MKATISFTLDTETDSDILHWYNSFMKRERSKAIRTALRENLGQSDITLMDVYQAVLALKRSGIVASNEQLPADEPADIVNTLDQLGV
ncbi:MAG: hypothetical protein GY792_30480 [Gammaproteobacteria bacterium]|nr:hypothetical protein [Gammaproteobacteria bacterium]